MDTPILVVNVKTYREGTGKECLSLARRLERLAHEAHASAAIAVQPTDVRMIAPAVKLPVLGQHIDPIMYGSHTGWVLPEAIKDAGAQGTLIDHSERPLSREIIAACIQRAGEVGLKTIVCADTVEKSREIAGLCPDFIAIEPPELIGGDISVTTVDPRIVRETVQKVKEVESQVKVLCGAGIKTGSDVAAALELGTDGVLLASGVVKAPHKGKVIQDLLTGLRQ